MPVTSIRDSWSDSAGPPYTARFTRHDVYPGGRSEYAMTGPDGDVHRGYWEFLDVPPQRHAGPNHAARSEHGGASLARTRRCRTRETLDARPGWLGHARVLLESTPPHRSVSTEQMADTEGPATVNGMTLTTAGGGTLHTVVITYPGAEVRDKIPATGMTAGMEISDARLQELLPTG